MQFLRQTFLWSVFATLACAFAPISAEKAEEPKPRDQSAESKQSDSVRILYEDVDVPSRNVLAAAEADQFSVMIRSLTSDIFDREGKVSGGVGTGSVFILSKEKDVGFIVTNHHVVKSHDLQANAIRLYFTVPGEKDEEIPGKVIYTEPYGGEDLAVVQFKPSFLKRAVPIAAKLAPIPKTYEEFRRIYMPATPVLSHGNPSRERNSTTTGIISQLPQQANFDGKIYFKTDAPINPGNSGGPLIRIGYDKRFDPYAYAPLLLGINTIKRTNADSMGYAIPTYVWLPKVMWALNGGPEKSKGYLYLDTRPVTTKILIQDQLATIVDEGLAKRFKLEHSFFVENRMAVMVDHADPKSGLQSGDYIFAVNGEPVGSDDSSIYREITTTEKPSISFLILRNREMKEIDVKVENSKPMEDSRRKNFVMLSGLFLQDMLPSEVAEIAGGRKGVIIRTIISDGMGAHIRDQQGLVDEGAILYEVSIAGKVFPVANLDELKAALLNIKLDEFIWIKIFNSALKLNKQTREITESIASAETSIYIQVHELLTDEDFSLEDLKRKIDPEHIIPGSRDWRRITGLACRLPLKQLAALSDHQ